jgi:hypothetical protein
MNKSSITPLLKTLALSFKKSERSRQIKRMRRKKIRDGGEALIRMR